MHHSAGATCSEQRWNDDEPERKWTCVLKDGHAGECLFRIGSDDEHDLPMMTKAELRKIARAIG
jgi:hypothetical protein